MPADGDPEKAALYRQHEADRRVLRQALARLSHEVLDTEFAPLSPLARTWVNDLLDYTVEGGKMNRAVLFLDTYRQLACDGGAIPDGDQAALYSLALAVEVLQAYFLVADDLMDGSELRRGAPCWYRYPRVGVIAANDALLLENLVKWIVRKHFRAHPKYLELQEDFDQANWETIKGQLLDLITMQVDDRGPLAEPPQPSSRHSGSPADQGAGETGPGSAAGGSVGPPDVPFRTDQFTMAHWEAIVVHKTAYYTFVLPMMLAIHAAQLDDEAVIQAIRALMIQFGILFQAQDDYLDCFGTYEQLKKVGTDIQDAKCSWLAVQALARVTPEQRTVFVNHYGRADPACIARIKALFSELGLPARYEAYQTQLHRDISDAIGALTHPGLARAARSMLAKVYKRTS